MDSIHIYLLPVFLVSIIVNGYLLYSRFKIKDVDSGILKERIRNPEQAFKFGLAANELERRGEGIDEAKLPLLDLLESKKALTRWRAWAFLKRHYSVELTYVAFNWRKPREETKVHIRKLLDRRHIQ